MKRVLPCFFIVLLFSCKKNKETMVLPKPTNPNLTYFGYTLVDVLFDDPSDSDTKTNYIDEVASFSNIADILVIDPTDNIQSRLDLMKSHKVEALIHLNEIFFEQEGMIEEKSGTDYKLRSDYIERWNTFVSVNDFDIAPNNLAGFYLGEEPFWNSITAEELTLASDHIKSTVPSVPIFIVEAYPSIDELIVPESADWVGFDHYFIADPLNNGTYQTELAKLKSKISDDQKIMLILDAHYLNFAHGSSGIAQEEMDVVAMSYYDLANSDPQIIGIIGYHWPSGFEFNSVIGARHFPEHVLNLHKEMGKAITGK